MRQFDKELVIMVVGVLSGIALFKLPPDLAAGTVEKAFLGLFGIATGYAISEAKQAWKNRAKKNAPTITQDGQ